MWEQTEHACIISIKETMNDPHDYSNVQVQPSSAGMKRLHLHAASLSLRHRPADGRPSSASDISLPPLWPFQHLKLKIENLCRLVRDTLTSQGGV